MADTKQDGHVGTPSSVPIPDPTKLTQDQIDRAIDCLTQIIETRLHGIDTSIAHIEIDADRVSSLIDHKVNQLQALLEEKFRSIETQFKERDTRTEQTMRDNKSAIDAALLAAKDAGAAIDEKTAHLEALHDEKFRSIETQFRERDTRTEQTSKEAKTGIDAALQAAEKAVGKTEVSFTKQIDQQQVLIQQAKSELHGIIDGVKERLTRTEGKELGQTDAKGTQQTSSAFIVSIIAVLVALAGLVVVIVKMN